MNVHGFAIGQSVILKKFGIEANYPVAAFCRWPETCARSGATCRLCLMRRSGTSALRRKTISKRSISVLLALLVARAEKDPKMVIGELPQPLGPHKRHKVRFRTAISWRCRRRGRWPRKAKPNWCR